MVHDWPAEHTYKNLKREVLLKLIEDRDEMATKLQPHLDKQSLSYKQAVEAIHERDDLEEIPEGLGDFIIAAISLTTGIPIFIVYPITEKKQDPGTLRTITKNSAKTEFLFRKDKSKATHPHASLVVLAYNGIDYYAPTIPKEIATMTRNASNARTHLCDAENLLKDLLDKLPPSICSDTISKAVKFMGAANSCLISTSLATGTADVANLPTECAVPKPSAPSAVAKTAHRRAAAMLDEAPPEKRSGERDQAFKDRKNKYKTAVAKAALRDTKLGKNQCPCAETFSSFEALLEHQRTIHPNKKSWKCSICSKVYTKKGHVWSHARKHLGKYYHYCDVDFKDDTDLDSNNQPKNKVCIKGSDEITWIQFHRETVHGVGQASVRCKYCNRPQQSVRARKKHYASCEDGPHADGSPTQFCDYCTYGCRSVDTLRNHLQTHHPEEAGLKEAKRWRCQKCGKLFTSRNGFRGHDCTKPKPRKRRGRKPSSTVSTPDLSGGLANIF